MKKSGLLLSFLLLAGITIAQTEANTEINTANPEQETILEDSDRRGSDFLHPPAKMSYEKKHVISSAARKSSLIVGRKEKYTAYYENNAMKETYKSVQARRPSPADKPPKVALLVIPPSFIINPKKMFIPSRHLFPSIGRFSY